MQDFLKKHPRFGALKHYVGRMAHLLGRVVANGAYMNWVYVINDQKKLIFLAVQKVACTSIKASVLDIPEQDNYLDVHEKTRGRWKDRIDRTRYADYYLFTFVRNPYQRLISCYENKYHEDLSMLGNQRDHLVYQYYLCGYIAKDRGFSDFVKRVCRIPDRLADRHFVSQSFLIHQLGRGKAPDFIGRFERLEEDYQILIDKFGLAPLPHYNQTHRENSNWMDYYTPETCELVYRHYKKDMLELGYEKEYRELKAYLQKKAGQTAA